MTLRLKRAFKSVLILVSLMLLLTGCSNTASQQNSNNQISPDKIDLTLKITSCTVFRDHIECNMTDGITYYAMYSKIMELTKWDCSAWKDNPC